MLRVLGRRADGYHRLQTVFQFIDHLDYLWFEPRTDGVVRRLTDLPGVPIEADLTVRAARALQHYSGCRLGVDIRIDKRLPMGGGLGGGSSDAATTLVALDRLWGLDLGGDTLAKLALALGADVPVFVGGQAAWGEGVGEELTPVTLPEPWYLVVVPPCGVSTRAVFTHPRLTRDSVAVTLADFFRGDRRNDCASVVREAHPEVAQALDWLTGLDGASGAFLTGTGACCFAPFTDETDARRANDSVPATWSAFVAKGLNRSPLMARRLAGQ